MTRPNTQADRSASLPSVDPAERPLYLAAAERALERYPGPVGELIHRELLAYGLHGNRFASYAS